MKLLLSFALAIFAFHAPVFADPSTGIEPIMTKFFDEDGANQFGVLCLLNETGIGVNYSYKWGNNPWKSANVSAGNHRWHAWRYAPGSSSSPTFQIDYDYDLRPGRNSRKTYTLKRYSAPFEACDYGKKYKFKRVGDFIEVHSMN